MSPSNQFEVKFKSCFSQMQVNFNTDLTKAQVMFMSNLSQVQHKSGSIRVRVMLINTISAKLSRI